jgi:hypothetical protein
MHYSLCNGLGDSIESPTPAEMRAFMDGVDSSDEEHGAVWLSDEIDNALEYNGKGVLAFTREGVDSRHLTDVSRERAIELWIKLANGLMDELENEPWQPGAAPPRSREEVLRHEREIAEWRRQEDLKFYDGLGAERAEVACRTAGCGRGCVRMSVFCRVHHFESVNRRACPFEH